MSADENRIEIAGTLIELDALRYTPGGVPIVRFRISHESSQIESGSSRNVSCEIGGVAFEREARLIATATVGAELSIKGFLDRKSRNSSQLILHAVQIEFKKSN